MATRPLLNSSDCNCLAVRQAARYITQFYDRYLAAAALRTTQYGTRSLLRPRGQDPGMHDIELRDRSVVSRPPSTTATSNAPRPPSGFSRAVGFYAYALSGARCRGYGSPRPHQD